MAADDDLRRVLIDAKLSGTNKQIGDEWGYAFRTNEQAAELAIDAILGNRDVVLRALGGALMRSGLDGHLVWQVQAKEQG